MRLRLDTRETDALLRLVRSWATSRGVEELAERALDVVALVPASHLAFSDVEPARGRMTESFGPGPMPGAIKARLVVHVDDHPLVGAHAAGDMRIQAISDHLSERDYHATGMYQEVYGVLGDEDQISVPVPAPPGHAVALALNRTQRGFSERDRALLALLHGHLASAYETARAWTHARAALRALERELADSGRHAVLVDRDGRVVSLTAGAEALLAEAAGGARPGPGRLPEVVAGWLADQRRRLWDATEPQPPIEALRVSVADGRVVVGLMPGRARDEPDVLTLRRIADPLSDERLMARGLRRREAHTLRLAAAGLSDAEIARRLGISIRTVQGHLRAAYRRLGVTSRSAAVAVVLGIDADGRTDGAPTHV